MRGLAVAAVAVTSLVPAGCGAGRAENDAGRALGPRLELGRKLFADDCAGCHSLAGREHGAVGGDLVDAHLGTRDIASFARVMPTPRRLSPTDVAAVAEYVEHMTRSTGRSP